MDETEKAVRGLFERHGKSHWLAPQYGKLPRLLRMMEHYPDLDLASLQLTEELTENGLRFCLVGRLSTGMKITARSAPLDAAGVTSGK